MHIKRSNHLNELLSQIQAKESTEIPKEIYNKITTEIQKKRLNIAELNNNQMRTILRKLKLHKYYEHIPHIISKINGKCAPNIPREVEDKIKQLFKETQEPFMIYCPKSRKNYLSYAYVLHKFCELLELDEYLEYFPLLKNHSKLKDQDKIWKNICSYLNWEFIASI